MMTNWKTTVAGVAPILTGLGMILQSVSTGALDARVIMEGLALISVGLGLFKATDAR